MSEMTKSHDVVIAGAGPVGLFLACELRLANLEVLILEREKDPHSVLKGLPFGMRGLTIPTIEAFDRRGLLDAFTAPQAAGSPSTDTGRPQAAHWMHQQRRPGGHFAGIQFFQDKIDTAKWPYRLPGSTPDTLATSMQQIESVLAARAIAMGVDIRRGQGVDGLEQSAESVTIRAGKETLNAAWLIGCDGGRSTVRKMGGFLFEGTEPEFTGYSVQVQLADPDALSPGRHYTPAGMYTYQKPGIIAMVDFDGGAHHRVQPITLDHAQAVLRRVSGTGVTVTQLDVATTWTDRAYQATAYRNGRIILAGDAAHIHSPLGGQGLDLGLGDAMNLGWKLATTIHGYASDSLLDSYASERHPVGARVLDWSRAQVAIMRPSRSSRAVEAILRDLIETPDGATYFAERVWGVSLGYDLGGGHPLIGHSVPAFEFADGTKLSDHFRGGRGLLVDFTGDASVEAIANAWRGRIDYIAGEARNSLGLSALLVRPDGIIAWVAESSPDGEALAKAATRWFGKA